MNSDDLVSVTAAVKAQRKLSSSLICRPYVCQEIKDAASMGRIVSAIRA